MTLLIDTHALLWFLKGDPQLSLNAKMAMEDPQNRKFVSVASCWEIAIKAGLGKLKLDEPSRDLLDRELPKNSFDLLGITLMHATAVEALPMHHKDPFDRILVAQAREDKLDVVSNDVQLDAYGIKRIW